MAEERRMRAASRVVRDMRERNFRSKHALAGVQIELGFDEKLFRHRCGPEVAADFKCDAVRARFIGLSDGSHRERVRDDSGLEIFNRLDHLVLDGCYIEARCELSTKVGSPEIQHRTADFAELIPVLFFQMRAGIQQPAQIAQHAIAVARQRYDAGCPAVLLLLGVLVREAIKQTWLDFLGDDFSHDLGCGRERGEFDGAEFEQRELGFVRREEPLTEADVEFLVLLIPLGFFREAQFEIRR